MALSRKQKEAVVEQVSSVASTALSAVAAEYRGMTVEQMTALRSEAYKTGVYVKVVKNTLARIALKDTEFDCMGEELKGPLMLAFSLEDPGAAARLVRDFAKEHDELVTKVVAIGGTVFPPEDLKRLADLPTRDQALAMLMGVMKAPVEKLVRTLAEPQAKLVRTFAALREQKEAA